MNIYNHTAGDRTPFTYLIGWSHLNKWYYGVRYAKNCHPNSLWTTYFTSSKHVKRFIEANGEPDIITVRLVFSCTMRARRCETRVLFAIPKNLRKSWLNKKKFDNAKTENVNPHPTLGYTNEYRSKNGLKLIPGKPKGSKEKESTKKMKSATRKGKVAAEDVFGNCFLVDKNDLRLLSGELTNCSAKGGKKNKGKAHTPETRKHLSEVCKGRVPWNKGKRGVQVGHMKGKKKPRCCCIICKKEVDQLNLGKYHKHLP